MLVRMAYLVSPQFSESEFTEKAHSSGKDSIYASKPRARRDKTSSRRVALFIWVKSLLCFALIIGIFLFSFCGSAGQGQYPRLFYVFSFSREPRPFFVKRRQTRFANSRAPNLFQITEYHILPRCEHRLRKSCAAERMRSRQRGQTYTYGIKIFRQTVSSVC